MGAGAAAGLRLRRTRSSAGPPASASTALALFLRIWHLGTPKRFEFDETYYAKDAWSLAHFGYVAAVRRRRRTTRSSTGTTTGIWKDDPSLIVHPEVGKWLIALGEKAFGMDPFGWRIAAVVAGALMVLVMCRLAQRLTGSTLLGCIAGLLLSFDGLHFVLSRLALLDIFLALFMLLRRHVRGHRPRLVPRPAGPRCSREPVTDAASWGPIRGLLLRPWLLVERACFWGLALGTKWTALFPLAAFGLLVWFWSARRPPLLRRPLARSALGARRRRPGLRVGRPARRLRLHRRPGPAGWSTRDEYEDAYSSTQYTRFSGEGHCDGETLVDDDPERRPLADRHRSRDASGSRRGGPVAALAW